MTDVDVGLITALAAGIINGSFAVPTKYTSRWRWENIWAVWAVVALFLTPWLLGFLTVPDLLGFYRNTSVRFIVLLIACGLGVGIAQIFFGLALARVGLSIGFAVTIGLSTAIGSLLPLLVLRPRAALEGRGLTIIAGVSLMLIGTAFCGVASNRKERESGGTGKSAEGESRNKFSVGLLFCILSGVLAPLLNLALAFGAPLLARAAQLGVTPANQANVIWPPLLTATVIPYLAYCSYLWRQNRTFHLFALPGTGSYWALGAMMGLLWTGSLILYGAASTRMAPMGPILGWPLFMSVVIITSNVWGVATGEWKGARPRTRAVMLMGIAGLILGFCAVARASRP